MRDVNAARESGDAGARRALARPPAAVENAHAMSASEGARATLRRWWPLLALALAALACRALTLPRTPEGLDPIHFVRALQRFSLEEMRPHWPGYPAYIWAGRLFQTLFRDPADALHALAVFANVSTIGPLAALAASWSAPAGVDPRRAALAAGVAWACTPLSWITGSEIYSDSPALLLAACCWLACDRLLAQADYRPALLCLAGALAGWTVGTRPSYVFLLGPWVVAVGACCRRWGAGRALRAGALGLAAGCLPWLAWLAWEAGPQYLVTGRTHLEGHFMRWGGSVWSETALRLRPLRVAEALYLHGLGGWLPGAPLHRLPATIVLGGLAVVGAARLIRLPSAARSLSLAWFVPYAAAVLVLHDPDLPRYQLPLAACACVWAGLGLPRSRGQARVAVAALALACLAVTAPLARAHRALPPVEFRLAAFLRDDASAAQLLTRDNPLLVLVLRTELPEVPVDVVSQSQLSARALAFSRSGRTVYSTHPSPERPEEWLAVARFCRQPYLDPGGARELWLFRFEPSPPARLPGVPECR